MKKLVVKIIHPIVFIAVFGISNGFLECKDAPSYLSLAVGVGLGMLLLASGLIIENL